MFNKEDKIEQLLTKGVAEVIEKKHLEKRLMAGEKLRVKFGVDPTASDLHLGHTVALRKLKQFQDSDHQVIFLIGDFTAAIGDPSGRSEARKPLSKEKIKENMKTYQKQAGKILDMKKLEVRHNSEWYDKLGAEFIFEITSKFTVARIMERDDFKRRIKEDIDISMLEIIYPLLQGYDSVELEADVEIGGTDQKFNLLTGRKVQRRYGKLEQDIITVPLLEGTDGIRKMSKTFSNIIGINENLNDMFNKIMSIPDSIMMKYFTLLTDVSKEELKAIKEKMKLLSLNPRDAKMRLAYEIVKNYHGEKETDKAQENFIKIFQKKEIPDNISEIKTKKGKELLDIFIENKIISSKSEFRRLMKEGAIDVDGKNIKNAHYVIEKEVIIKIGKKKFVKIII
ncbi:MAG: tyrosine--tRNA ligase [Patescibacteria group bacterium]